MSPGDKESKKLFMVGTVSLGIGIAFGLLSQTSISETRQSVQTPPVGGLDRAVVTRHCRDVLQSIERDGVTTGDIQAGFADKYSARCDQSR